MKKMKQFNFIFDLIILVFVCFSSNVFAGQTGYSGMMVETTIKNDNTTLKDTSNSEIYIAGDNLITITDELTNQTHELILQQSDEGKNYYTLDGNEIQAFTIKNENGATVAQLSPNSITYDETTGNYKMILNRNLTEEDFSKLRFEVKTQEGTVYSDTLAITNVSLDNSRVEDTSMSGLVDWGTLGIGIKTFSDIITLNGKELLRTVNYIVNSVLIPLGDGILSFVSRSVGSVVTIDNLVFGNVERVSINYWDDTADTSSVRFKMSGVLKYWYNVFYKVAIIVYMMILVIVGILVMLESTAEKKAKYKDILVSWVVGVAILTLFPYVMKYIVDLNNAFVQTFKEYAYGKQAIAKPYDGLITAGESTVHHSYGKDAFVKLVLGPDIVVTEANGNYTIQMSKISDIMMQTRILGDKLQQAFLTVIYLILLGETVVLLIMYYKRAFMIAFLITIFPLVAMTYVIDKLGDRKAQSFEIWFKEYIVNVIVQIFHAAVYILVVASSIKSYLATNGRNWLYVILSVLFLFQGEKIFRNIFGIKSSAKTIGDLATTGLATYGALKSVGKLSRKGDKNRDKNATAQDNADMAGINARNQSRALASTKGTPSDTSGGNAGGSGGSGGSEPGGPGAYTGNDPEGVDTRGFDMNAAFDNTVKGAMERRITRGLASRAVRFSGGMVGATMGATREMAKGDTGNGILGTAIVGAGAGREIGEWATTPLTSGVNKIEQVAQGRKVAKNIENGSMDKELGLDAAALSMMPADVNPGEIVGTNGETMQEIYRKALEEAAKAGATGGRAKAQVKFLKYIDKHTEKKS